MTEQIDLLFTDAVRGMRGADAAARRSSGEVERRAGPRPRPRSAAWTSSTPSSASRHLDLAARWLRAQGEGFYTIGSAGHEGNAAVAAALRPTDPALLHYRSGGFYLARAPQVPASPTALRDVLLGLVAAADEPIAGGRHKVFGHAEPRRHPADLDDRLAPAAGASGVAFALGRARRLGVRRAVAGRRGRGVQLRRRLGEPLHGDRRDQRGRPRRATRASPLPLLLVCEDNGLGISVRTPAGWVAAPLRGAGRACVLRRPTAATWPRRYDAADAGRGLGPRAPAAGVPAPADGAADGPRGLRRRVGLPHARPRSRADLARATRCSAPPGCSSTPACRRPDEVLDRYEAKRREVLALAAEVDRAAPAHVAEAVMAPLAPRRARRGRGRRRPARRRRTRRAELFGGRLPEDEGPLTLAQTDQPRAGRRCWPVPRDAGLRRGRRRARAACTA